MTNVNQIGKDLGKVVLDSVEIKINFKTLFDGVVDNVVEKAIDEVVASSETKFDDSAKAMLWPILEPKLKELLDKEAAKVQAIFDGKIKELKDAVSSTVA